MLMHHSAKQYETAAREAADWALPKFNKIVDEGKANLQTTITKIAATHPRDAVVGSRAFEFGADKKGFRVKIPKIDEPISFHPHALVQGHRAPIADDQRGIQPVRDLPGGSTLAVLRPACGGERLLR